jgi:hypothetical protein
VARTFPFLRQNGADVLIVLAIALGLTGAYFLQNAFVEASGKVGPHLQDPMTVRFAVDPYIWSPAASRALRRRYVIGQVILLCGFASGAALAWMNDLRPVAIIAALAIVGAAGHLIFRSIRHGL